MSYVDDLIARGQRKDAQILALREEVQRLNRQLDATRRVRDAAVAEVERLARELNGADLGWTNDPHRLAQLRDGL